MKNVHIDLKVFFKYIIIVILVYNFGHTVDLYGVRPDILLVFVFMDNVSLNNRYKGSLKGFLCGLFYDLLRGSVIGLSSLSMSIAGFTGAALGHKFTKHYNLNLNIVFFFINIFHCIIFYNIELLGSDLSFIFVKRVLIAIIYNQFLYIILMILLPQKYSNKKKYFNFN